MIVRSGRIRDWADLPDGFQATHRPVPSAGGRHPCSLLIAAHGVDGLKSGWWSFDAATCSLSIEQISPSVDSFLEQQQMLGALARRPMAAVVVVAALVDTQKRRPAEPGALVAAAGLGHEVIEFQSRDPLGVRIS